MHVTVLAVGFNWDAHGPILCRMRRISCVAVLTVAAIVVGLGSVAAPAGAATPDPCKVLTTSEISKAFDGATVAKGTKGLSTAVNKTCDFEVTGAGTLPDGAVNVTVMFIGAKAAYDGIKKFEGYAPLPELGSSVYNEKLSVINTLKGKILLGVQGNFLATDPLPIHSVDVKSQLISLSKTGLKRV